MIELRPTGGSLQTIQVAFDGHSPIEEDFHGIKQLLTPVHLDSPVPTCPEHNSDPFPSDCSCFSVFKSIRAALPTLLSNKSSPML